MLNIINQIMDVCIPQDRAPRDFCVKFPEEIRHDSLAGQLWFGAEVAGSQLGPGSRCGALGRTCVHLRGQGPGVSLPLQEPHPPWVTDGRRVLIRPHAPLEVWESHEPAPSRST